MGSVLRSRQFLKTMLCVRRLSLLKCAVPTCFRRMDLVKAENLHIYSCHQMQRTLPKIENTFYQSKNSLDRMLYKLDFDVRRDSRLTIQAVEKVLNEVKQLGKINSNQALLLIRCCGSVLPDETLSVRIDLTNRVWNMLSELTCEFDVSHYNALLKDHLENECKFLPTDFLASMEEKGIEPNRVTYQRLVAKYCQDGDIVGASKILEFMKEKDMPVSELIFNSLVTGHAKAGDLAGAREILNVMRNAKLDPTAHTYSRLACGYAAAGDIDGLQQVLKEATENEVFLVDEDYLEVIRELAVNGHRQHIGEMIPKLHMNMGYNQHCIATIFELVNAGHEDIGFMLLKTMPRTTFPDGGMAPAGNFFIRQLVRADLPLDKILHHCKEMKAFDLNSQALTKAAEMALLYHKADLALSLFKEMQAEGLPVRTHYFWPIFLAVRKDGEEAVYSVLKTMVEMDCQISYETYTDYVLPGLNMADPDVLIQRIKDLGLTVGSVINPMVQYYLLQQKPSMAADLVEKYPVRLNSILLSRLLAAETCKETGNLKLGLQILKHMEENPETFGTSRKLECCGQFLVDYVTQSDIKSSNLKSLLTQMKSMDFRISHSSMESIQKILSGTANQDVIKMLKTMVSSDIDSRQDNGIPHPSELPIEELESHLIELQSKGLNTRGVLRHLLMAHCRKHNYSRAIEIKAEMEKQGMDFTPAIYSNLMELCSGSDKLEEAFEYKTLAETTPSFIIDDFKILNLASALVSKDRFQDAENLILSYKGKHNKRDNPESLSFNAVRVMTPAVEKGNVEQVKKLFDLLFQGGYSTVNTRLLGPLVKVHLVNNDIPAAVAAFENLSSLYKATPCRNELCKSLIESEDPENLQKVLDIATEIHGEVNALHDLAGSFLECGRIKQARKIFETPGLRARQFRLNVICEHFLELNMTQEISYLIEATDRLFDVNQEKLHQYLLRAYAKENNVEQALGIWTTMQEKDIVPSYETLNFLAGFLKANNRPVPFSVPVPEPANTEENMEAIQMSSNSNLQKLVLSGCIDEALDEKERMEELRGKIGFRDCSILIEGLVKARRLTEAVKLTEELLARGQHPFMQVFRFLLGQLASVGDISSLLKLKPSLDTEILERLSFQNKLGNAYINSNRYLELLEHWETDLAKSKLQFPAGSFLGFLQRHPQQEDRLLQLADRFVEEENFFQPLNMVWMHWMLNENFDKASEVYKRLQGMTDPFMYRSVVRHATETKNDKISSKLYSLAKESTLKSMTKGQLIGCHLNVLVASGKHDEALAILQEQTTRGGLALEDFHVICLHNLKSELEAAGKPVPFVVPPRRKVQREDSSSSSSDDEN